jgi:hypothetical protein
LVSVKVQAVEGGDDWWLTVVYGPTNDSDKPAFLMELHNLRLVHSDPWLLTGDFNMIYKAEDKNNDRINRTEGRWANSCNF